MTISPKYLMTGLLAGAATLSGCTRENMIDPTGGIYITRTSCPPTAIAANTGDITLFSRPGSRNASDMDVTASITNLRTTCDDSGAEIVTQSTFEVRGSRIDARGPRQVVLPIFTVIVRGGQVVESKRIGQIALNFADGNPRAQATGTTGSVINKDAATLPADIREQIVKNRKPGDPDAAIDPLSLPDVKAAVGRATFEVLVGFQLTEDQLRYNVTR